MNGYSKLNRYCTSLLAVILITTISFTVSPNYAYAIDFTDHTGYIPSWAEAMGDQQVLATCLNIEFDTPDKSWCIEFAGYVSDKLSSDLESDNDSNTDYKPSNNKKIFEETVKQVPYDSYVNKQYGFSITPPSQWDVKENDALVGGEEAAIVSFISNEFNPTYTPNFFITYRNLGSSYVDLLRWSTDQEILDDFLIGFLSDVQAKMTDKNIESFIDGYVINVDFTQTTKISTDETKFATVQREYFVYILDNGDMFVLSFAALPENYESSVLKFREAVDTFYVGSVEVLSPPQAKPKEETSQSPTSGGGCLIATAAFGSELAPQVQMLREIRDKVVMQTQSGTAFMTVFNSVYYSFAPTVAERERENPTFKEVVKTTITPLITTLSILNYLDIDSEAEMLGYGIGIILLNIGMYFVAPAFVILKLKSKIQNR